MSILDDLTPISPTDPDYPHFFDDPPPPPKRPWFKVHHDGGHFIGQIHVASSTRPHIGKRKSKDDPAMNMMFDNLYFEGIQAGLCRAKRTKDGEWTVSEEMTEHLKNGLSKLFPNAPNIDEYIPRRAERTEKNLRKRVKRFRRKANLNRWNYFITVTYNDDLHDEDTFRRKLRKCLSNLHTRRGWKYMGVFERAPETGRLHFHAIVYIPDGEMIGQLHEETSYSTRTGQMQTAIVNSFFKANYGRNDFKDLYAMDMKSGRTLNYLLKYIGKTNEKLVYSRGTPTTILKQLDPCDIAVEMQDFGLKFVLFDDVIDWETDIERRKKKRQSSIWDYLCNPPTLSYCQG